MMQKRQVHTINVISSLFGQATVDLMEKATGVKVGLSTTLQKTSGLKMRPDIATFVHFRGDYFGLMVLNFSKEAAMTYYRNSLISMGMPEEELATEHTSKDVIDCIGELMNQIIGSVRATIEEQYNLSASNNPPQAICLLDAICLSLEGTAMTTRHCRRVSLRIDGHEFHIELFLEHTEFVALKADKAGEIKEIDPFEAALAQHQAEENEKVDSQPDIELDIDALIAQRDQL